MTAPAACPAATGPSATRSAGDAPLGTLAAVHTGRTARLAGDPTRRTAFVKTPVAGPVAIHPLGLAGDEQANTRVHGGPEKAVYAYPLSGYAGWRADLPDLADRFLAGAMGENLVVDGQDETSIHIGDIIRCGTVTLQVAQLREPCATLAAVFGTPRVVKAMTRSGRCGWYCRVLEPGTVTAGDPHAVIERPNPDWPVARFAAIASGKSGTVEALAQAATLRGLTKAWQVRIAKSLAHQTRG